MFGALPLISFVWWEEMVKKMEIARDGDGERNGMFEKKNNVDRTVQYHFSATTILLKPLVFFIVHYLKLKVCPMRNNE